MLNYNLSLKLLNKNNLKIKLRLKCYRISIVETLSRNQQIKKLKLPIINIKKSKITINYKIKKKTSN